MADATIRDKLVGKIEQQVNSGEQEKALKNLEILTRLWLNSTAAVDFSTISSLFAKITSQEGLHQRDLFKT